MEKTATQPFQMTRIARHSFIYGIGVVAARAIGFLMLPVYTRYLTPSDYGVLQLIVMTLEVALIFAGARISEGIFRFYHKAETDADRRQVMSTALFLLLATYGLTGAAASLAAPFFADLIFGSQNSYVLYIRIAALDLALQSLVVVPISYLQLRDRSKTFVAVNLVKLLLQLALNIILLIPFHMGVMGVLLSSLISHFLLGSFLAVFLIKEVGAGVSGTATRDLLRFGIPLVGMQIASFALTFGDRYFLVKASNTAVVGIYGLACQFGPTLLTLSYLPFARVWEPVRFEIAKRPDRDALYARLFVYANLMLITMALVFALFARDLLRIMADPAFHAAAPLIVPILVAYIFQAWMHFLNLGVLVRERTEFFTLATWIAAAVALAGYMWLIPRMLAWGAALATVFACGLRTWLVYQFSQRLWPVAYDWAPILRLSALAAALYTAAEVIAPDSVWLSVATRLALLLVFAGAVLWLDILPQVERKRLRKLVSTPRVSAARIMSGGIAQP